MSSGSFLPHSQLEQSIERKTDPTMQLPLAQNLLQSACAYLFTPIILEF